MKRLTTAADEVVAKAERHRQWLWCRRENGFSDMPIWRVVARECGLPLCQVLAFVNRLEELANKSDPRGYVGEFSAAEFAAALDLAVEASSRIYAALEQPAIGWIVQEHVQSFYPRNPDKEDLGAAERKRAERARKRAMKELADLVRRGAMAAPERTMREAAVLLCKTEDEVRRAMSTSVVHMSRGHIVTGAAVDNSAAPVDKFGSAENIVADQGPEKLSTGHAGHNVTSRDIVTVTPRAEQKKSKLGPTVDNSGDAAAGDSAGSSEEGGRGSAGDPQAEAERWLESEGERIVTERMGEPRPLSATRIARWRDQQLDGNAVALMEVLRDVDKADYIGPRFHNLVVDSIKRWRQGAQPQLKLPPAGLKVRHG